MRMLLAAVLALAAAPARALNQPLPDWFNRVHMGGSGAMRYTAGKPRAQLERNSAFSVHEAGLVVDVDLAKDLSFWYDFALVREGVARSAQSTGALTHEQAYVRWDSLLGQAWLNAKIGRVFTPYGEEYLHWNAVDSAFASRTTAFPWALDEGVVLFGELLPEGRLAYAASLQNGNASYNYDDNPNKTAALTLQGKPLPWLRLMGSWINLGKQGAAANRGRSELWLSGHRLEPLGTNSSGSGASPSNIVDADAWEANAVAESSLGRGWLSGGIVRVRDGGGTPFDRRIRYMTTELLGYLPRTERRAYLAGRYSVVGTFSPAQGYRFAGTEVAFSALGNNSSPYGEFNFDQRELQRVSAAAGWDVKPNVRLKAEYSWERTLLIEPAKTAANLSMLGGRNFFIAELAFRF